MVYTDVSKSKNRYFFGPIHTYNQYIIDDGNFKGININKKVSYISVNDYTFLKETKILGRKLFYLLKENLIPINKMDKDFSLNEYLINSSNLSINIKETILNCLVNFLKTYGIPISYLDLPDGIENDHINIDLLCTLFMLTYMIPCIANAYYKKDQVLLISHLLNIPIKNTSDLTDFINNGLSRYYKANDFKLTSIDNYPVYLCKNIFSFSFKRIIFDIVDKRNSSYTDLYATNTCHQCGEVIERKEQIAFGKSIRTQSFCEECDGKYDNKLSNNQRAKKQYKKKKDMLLSIRELREKLYIMDTNNEYIEIIDAARKINNVHKIILKSKCNSDTHSYLLLSLKRAIESIENKNKR